MQNNNRSVESCLCLVSYREPAADVSDEDEGVVLPVAHHGVTATQFCGPTVSIVIVAHRAVGNHSQHVRKYSLTSQTNEFRNTDKPAEHCLTSTLTHITHRTRVKLQSMSCSTSSSHYTVSKTQRNKRSNQSKEAKTSAMCHTGMWRSKRMKHRLDLHCLNYNEHKIKHMIYISNKPEKHTQCGWSSWWMLNISHLSALMCLWTLTV